LFGRDLTNTLTSVRLKTIEQNKNVPPPVTEQNFIVRPQPAEHLIFVRRHMAEHNSVFLLVST